MSAGGWVLTIIGTLFVMFWLSVFFSYYLSVRMTNRVKGQFERPEAAESETVEWTVEHGLN